MAVLNPLRTRRFAEEELERTKTDSVNALGIARFAAQKSPTPTPIADEVTAELRELVRLRTRYVDEHSDRMRQLHRAPSGRGPGLSRVHTSHTHRYGNGYRDLDPLSHSKIVRERVLAQARASRLRRAPPGGRGTRTCVNRDGQDFSGKSSLRGLPATSQTHLFGHGTLEKSCKGTRPTHRAQASRARSWKTPYYH
jgi:hypothetical protein